LFAGSLTTYSLYANQFLTHLNYTQIQVNSISVSAELAMCLPVALYGYLCDRYSPAPLSLFSGTLFTGGYLTAAWAYRADERLVSSGHPGEHYSKMTLAFVFIGAATSCMHIVALTTCAKAFGASRHRGLLLSTPLAAFGLSGMWQSQLGVALFGLGPGSPFQGDLDVFAYFVALGSVLFLVGILGCFGLGNPLEQNGRHEGELEGATPTDDPNGVPYGVDQPAAESPAINGQNDLIQTGNSNPGTYFRDPNMWLLAIGFVLATGIGEAYMNNASNLLVGTIVDIEYCPDKSRGATIQRSYHVSLLAVSSTATRLVVGAVSDRFAPLDRGSTIIAKRRGITISRVGVLLCTTSLLFLGCLLLSIPALHPGHSGDCRPGTGTGMLAVTTALVGIGYGSSFALVPIIINTVWGPQNFGTNWGVVATLSSFGVGAWSLFYAWVYQEAAQHVASNRICRAGWSCYGLWAVGTTIGVGLAMLAWTLAWKGKGGWQQKRIAV
ncbi:MFS general substrate transporter, partial [Thozetella sp. PMI_491]